MKSIQILFILLILSFFSCSSEYGDEEIINDVVANKSGRLINNFFNKHKLEKKEFKEVVQAYSKLLTSNKLRRVIYDDKFSFKKRKRHGYIFLDNDNNFIASVTFKYVMLQDSTYEINFIDFRNSLNDLPCIKFPSKFPIKCVALPMTPLPNIDSLKNEYPKILHGEKLYHTTIISKRFLEAKGDTLKRIISFNNGNKLISNNLSNILDKMNDKLGLKNYNLCESHITGEPTINLSYDPKRHEALEIGEIKSILESITKANVRLTKQATLKTPWGFAEPMITIGFPLSEAQVKIY